MEEDSGKANDDYPSAPVRRVDTPAGYIDNLDVHGYVAVLECKAGSRRSSHFHRTDFHWLYVVSGLMRYWERESYTDGDEWPRPKLTEYGPGQCVFTGPGREHWTEFPVDTVLVSVSQLHRTKEHHEADLVRVEWFE